MLYARSMTSAELLEILRTDVVEAAKALLGSVLVKGELRARIVETEAYRSDDPASHAFRGQTPRNTPMFGPPGRAYVYFTYGNHWMLNVTCHEPGDAAAVLIRAAEPLCGQEVMRKRRLKAERDEDLLSGPGKLAQAFSIDGRHNGLNVLHPASEIFFEPAEEPASHLVGVRIGIARGKGDETLWRFLDADRLRWASRPLPRR